MTFRAFQELTPDFAHGILWHCLFERPHPDYPPAKIRADLWSFVAAHADDLQFNYQLCAEMFNRRIAVGFHPISPPTPLEFLEILEFRVSEQERVLGGGDLNWQWPTTWLEKPTWNCHVGGHSGQPLPQQIDITRKGILVQKLAMGHGRELPLDHWAVDLISGMLRRLLDLPEFHVGYRPLLPLVISSLDLPQNARKGTCNDQLPTWDIDGTLGEYHAGDAITLHVRAIERCAADLRLPHRDVFLTVLIHETAHFIVHSVPDTTSKSRQNPWPTDAYTNTTSQVHEGLAQLLTFLTIGRFNDHHSRTFESLVENQSSDYRAFRDVLAITDDESRLMRSIVALRNVTHGATMDDWSQILRQ